MFHRIHQKLGTAGFIISIVALIAAIGGTALAAGGFTKSQEKQVTKIAKKYAGKPGANGTAGEKGAPGSNGTNGTNGTNGKDGKSVVSTAFTGAGEPAGEPCKENGGNTLEVEGSGIKHYVCNGQTGFTETLPPEKTETGAWVLHTQNESETDDSAFSFNIPLPATLAGSAVHYILPNGKELTEAGGEGEEEIAQSACLGNAAAPTAEPGNLCVYQELKVNIHVVSGSIFNPASFLGHGASTAGFYMSGNAPGATGAPHVATGTWAVTAP